MKTKGSKNRWKEEFQQVELVLRFKSHRVLIIYSMWIWLYWSGLSGVCCSFSRSVNLRWDKLFRLFSSSDRMWNLWKSMISLHPHLPARPICVFVFCKLSQPAFLPGTYSPPKNSGGNKLPRFLIICPQRRHHSEKTSELGEFIFKRAGRRESISRAPSVYLFGMDLWAGLWTMICHHR